VDNCLYCLSVAAADAFPCSSVAAADAFTRSSVAVADASTRSSVAVLDAFYRHYKRTKHADIYDYYIEDRVHDGY
jgi:hypothetical protein